MSDNAVENLWIPYPLGVGSRIVTERPADLIHNLCDVDQRKLNSAQQRDPRIDEDEGVKTVCVIWVQLGSREEDKPFPPQDLIVVEGVETGPTWPRRNEARLTDFLRFSDWPVQEAVHQRQVAQSVHEF